MDWGRNHQQHAQTAHSGRTGKQALSGPGHRTRTCTRGAAMGQDATVYTPRVGRTGGTQPTQAASGTMTNVTQSH